MRMSPSSLCCKTLIFLFLLALVELCVASKARHFKWEVGYLFWSPDCLENVVMGINGQFPGPTIRAKVGDTVVVHLTNKLHTEGLVIHWHGIRQFETPWADGTASISQCVINPEETFEYRFKVDKAGTYFYHGHYGMQRSAGLYGSLIVEPDVKEPFRYDGELNLLLSDWWHQGVHEQEVGLSSNPLRWIGEPQSILMNGRGQYNCSLAAHFKNSSSKTTTPLCSMRANAQCAPHVLHVLPNKIYRLRIASTTSLASLNLAIGHHKMVLVEADGNYVDPVTVDDLDIYSGETYSLLIKTDQNPSANYWVSASVRGRLPKTPPALTILNYLPNSAKLPTSPPPVAPAWNDYVHSKSFTKSIFALTGSPKPPAHPHRRIHLLNTQNKIKGFTKWAINNISLVLPSTPYLGSIKLGLTAGEHNQQTPPDNFSKDYDIMKPPINPNSTTGSGVYTLEFGRTIDVVLQNANALSANVSEIHPWHLHGHDFWVLGYGEGVFSEEKHSSQLNLKNPPLRNTVVIFPYGWTVIRFITDNPGVWAFHCHIEPHLHMGMGVIFSEAVKHITNIPNAAIGCGLTGKMLMNNSTKH